MLTQLYLEEVIAELRPELLPEQIVWLATRVVDFIRTERVPTVDSLKAPAGPEYWLP